MERKPSVPRYCGADEDAEHGEGLGGTASAERPGEEAGEEDGSGSGEGGEDTEGEDGVAEEEFAETGLEGDDGAVVDVTPGEMAAAGDVVELVAEVAVAEVLRPEGEGELEEQLCEGEEQGEAQGVAEGEAGMTG